MEQGATNAPNPYVAAGAAKGAVAAGAPGELLRLPAFLTECYQTSLHSSPGEIYMRIDMIYDMIDMVYCILT